MVDLNLNLIVEIGFWGLLQDLLIEGSAVGASMWSTTRGAEASTWLIMCGAEEIDSMASENRDCCV